MLVVRHDFGELLVAGGGRGGDGGGVVGVGRLDAERWVGEHRVFVAAVRGVGGGARREHGGGVLHCVRFGQLPSALHAAVGGRRRRADGRRPGDARYECCELSERGGSRLDACGGVLPRRPPHELCLWEVPHRHPVGQHLVRQWCHR